MDEETKRNLKLRSMIRDLVSEIDAEVEHGECFYDLVMLNNFCGQLDQLKTLSLAYYNSNKEEIDEQYDSTASNLKKTVGSEYSA